jgi:hypothetical protein
MMAAETPDRSGIETLERGREAYHRRQWRESYAALRRADALAGLAPNGLELLATVDRDDEAGHALDRAYHGHIGVGDGAGAARCAFWLGLGLADTGEAARAAGGFRRGRRVLDRQGQDCVERGYLLVPDVLDQLGSGDTEAVVATAVRMAEIGERFANPDLVAFTLVKEGRAMVKQGLVADGLALLDEGMLGVVAGEL